MGYITVSAAYGRSYKTAAAVRADWHADKDFRIETMGPSMGRYINKPQALAEGLTVNVRYNDNRSVCVITPKEKPPAPKKPRTKVEAVPVPVEGVKADLLESKGLSDLYVAGRTGLGASSPLHLAYKLMKAAEECPVTAAGRFRAMDLHNDLVDLTVHRAVSDEYLAAPDGFMRRIGANQTRLGLQ